MEFEKRLARAVERGRHTRDERGREAAKRALSEQELRSLHAECRGELCEQIEECLGKLADHFPGFQYESIVSEDGWGARVIRDDIGLASGGGADNFYSRLEMLVEPFSDARIASILAKGTIRNREVYNRSRYQQLAEIDIDGLAAMIDQWVLEYAEKFAAQD